MLRQHGHHEWKWWRAGCEATAQTLEALEAFLLESLKTEPADCQPGGPNGRRPPGFAGMAGFADTSEKWLDMSTVKVTGLPKDAEEWARTAFVDDELKAHTFKVSACADACADWARRMRGTIYPNNSMMNAPAGFNSDGQIGGCTNLGGLISPPRRRRLAGAADCARHHRNRRQRQPRPYLRLRVAQFHRRVCHEVFETTRRLSRELLRLDDGLDQRAAARLVTDKKGVLSYAKSPEDIQTSLGALFSVVNETSRGAFDAVVIVTYETYVKDAWVEIGAKKLNFLNAASSTATTTSSRDVRLRSQHPGGARLRRLGS